MFDKLTFKRRKLTDPTEEAGALEEPMTVDQAADAYADRFDEQSFWQKCRRYAGAIGRNGLEKAFTLYYATEHKNCTFAHKTAIYGALGYLLAPIDAIPDLTPLLGYTDDVGLIGTALVAVASCIDEGTKHKAKDRVGRLLGDGALDGIRLFHEEDIESVLGIWLTASISAHPFLAPDYWTAQVDTVRATYLSSDDLYVYEKAGQVVGFYILAEQQLIALCVAPTFQGQGIGRQLMAHVKAHHTPLTWTLFKANQRAIQFAAQHGFVEAQESLENLSQQPICAMRYIP